MKVSLVVHTLTKKVARSISSKGFFSSVYFDKKVARSISSKGFYSSAYIDEKSGKKY